MAHVPSEPTPLQRFGDVLDVLPDAVVVTDGAGCIVFANRPAADLSGYPPAELVGLPVEELVPERQRERHEKDRAALAARGNPPRPMGAALDTVLRRRDGTEVPVDIALAPLPGPDGPLVVSSIRDATERRRAESAIRRGERRWRSLAEQVQLAVVEIDVDGRVGYVNPWFARLSGYQGADIAGVDFFERFLPEQSLDPARGASSGVLSELLCESRRFDASPMITRTGDQRLVNWFTTPQHDADGRPAGILGVGEDVTEREEASALLLAVNKITRALLDEPDADAILRLICREARMLVRAEVSTIAAPVDERTLMIRVADGAHAAEVEGMTFTPEQSVSGAVIRSGQPEILDDAALDPRIHQPIIAVGGIGPSLFVPLVSRGRPFGTILAARQRGGRLFAEREMKLLETFAGQAAVTIEYSRAQQQRQRLTVVEERERIARDLHDKVIQQLFATGMGLEAVLRLAGPGDLAERVQRAIEDLDTTIGDIRSTIFALEATGREPTGLRGRMLDMALEVAPSLGFEPRLRFDGAVDSTVDAVVTEHVLAIVREALSNVARHARADRVDVSFDIDRAGLICRVIDNGVGLPPQPEGGGLGLRNMGERARLLGGSLEISAAPGGGTRVELRVPGDHLAASPGWGRGASQSGGAHR